MLVNGRLVEETVHYSKEQIFSGAKRGCIPTLSAKRSPRQREGEPLYFPKKSATVAGRRDILRILLHVKQEVKRVLHRKSDISVLSIILYQQRKK